MHASSRSVAAGTPSDASVVPPGEGAVGPTAPSPGTHVEPVRQDAGTVEAAHAPIELLLRLRPGLDDPRHHDVAVSIDAGHRVTELVAALAGAVGASHHADRMRLTSLRTGHRFDPADVVADVDLVSGDELVLDLGDAADGGPPSPANVADPEVLALDVVAGPDSGCSHRLGPGRLAVGRRACADITIDDPSVSRHHVDLVVERVGHADWRVVVHPVPDAANGLTVNGDAADEPTVVTECDVIALGGTRLVVRRSERAPAERIDRLGQIDFHRTPYRPTVVAERHTAPIGPIPERPEPRRFQVFAVLAPLAAGLMMYAFTKQVTFLALTLVSPVVMIATAVDDRRTGRRTFAGRLATFRDDLAEARRDLERLRHDERIDRLRSAPDLADLIRRAELRTIDLWSRGRDAPDLLTLRLGLGVDHVRFPIELDRGGDDDLRDEARSAVAGLDTIDDVPVTVDLRADPVAGLHGEADLVDGVVASLVVQAATLHSPEDLAIVAAVAPERRLGWMKWLPHLRAVTSPLPGRHLVTDRPAADALVRHLVELAQHRHAAVDSMAGRNDVAIWPRVLLVLDDELGLDPAETSRLLDLAPRAAISVLWLASSSSGVPRQASRILEVGRAPGAAMTGRLWSTDPDVAERSFEVEHLRRRLAERAARALAPVRDASTASLAASIPRTAPLLDVLGVGTPTAEWVAERWRMAAGYHLRFPIGLGVDGPLELDLVGDGPHTLVGGTSGAGKSELLQSMVAALAARYSPTRLNFLFVDYKGGASSQVFERLPHTVGYVTNLSADLSLRALTSLRAELDRRMAVMEGRAKDLEEMIERHPDEAPASLVIVVDEFATLVKEVPEFVSGIIDIAQRGRSLGIHLVLATQRPSGSVDENILANTNLRISLRMLDRTDSSAIIDCPDAADIPVPLRGRALARLGPRRLVEFQSAFAGAGLVGGDVRAPVLVTSFDRTDASPRRSADVGPGSDDADPVTHLDSLLDAIVDADASLGLPAPRRPWRDVLPDVVTLDRVRADVVVNGAGDWPATVAERDRTGAGRFVTVGLLDAPEQQAQHPAVVDLEAGGGWLVFGTGGSGKTTLLRTVAASIAADGGDGDVAIVAFDFASRGLIGLAALPEVIDVATGDDLEAVTRHLARLDTELERRRRVLADAGAEHLTAYHRDHAGAVTELPRIVVLIDGFGGLQSTVLESSGSVTMAAAEEWSERVQRIVIDGRQVGIHTVITADRRNAVPARIHAAIANRLILRHADEGAYAEHGIGGDRARHLDLPPGRGLLQGSTLIQIASVSGDPAARAQHDAVSALAERLGRPPTPTLASERLPERLLDAPADVHAPHRCAIGTADITGAAVVADLGWSHLTVCGPPRSGRSTAALTMVRGLGEHHDLTVVGPATSPLAAQVDGLPGTDRSRLAFGRADVLAPVLERLASQVEAGGCRRPPVLIVDDADTLDDAALTMVWERLVQLDELRLVAALEHRAMTGFTTSAVVNAARRARRVLVLQPDDPAEFLQTTGVRLPLRPGMRMVPGRGVFLADRQPVVVQIADRTPPPATSASQSSTSSVSRSSASPGPAAH